MSSYVPKSTPGDTAWFRHDRFGMFIHWGLYSMPARHEWVKTNQDVLKHNVTLAVVHKDNGYYVFINGTLVLSLTGQDATDIDNHIGTENVQVGVYAEFEVTYAEWSYSSDVSGYTLPNA